MRTALWSKSVRESEEVRFVNRVQHRDGGALDDFVLQRGNAERPLPPVRLRDVRATHRLRSVRSSFQPCGEVLEIGVQSCTVLLPRCAVDPRCRVSLHSEVRGTQLLDLVYVVKKRREPLFPIPPGCLPYTLERAQRAGPALSPEHVALGRVSLGPPPSLPRLHHRFLVGVRRVHWYYEAVRLPMLVRHRRVSSDFSMPPWCVRRQAWDLPAPVRDASARAWGLRPRRVGPRLALPPNAMLPSACFQSVGTLEVNRISRLNTQPMRPPVNASPSSLRANSA